MTQTLAQFTEKHPIKFSAREVCERPDNLMSESTYHFQCKLVGPQHRMSLYFSLGAACSIPPTLEEVLDCLASDASSYENAKDFENWARDYGYSEDSRAAEKVYRAVKRSSEQLKRVLGETDYQELLWETDRL